MTTVPTQGVQEKRLAMRLNQKDIQMIEKIKVALNATSISQVIRYALASAIDDIS